MTFKEFKGRQAISNVLNCKPDAFFCINCNSHDYNNLAEARLNQSIFCQNAYFYCKDCYLVPEAQKYGDECEHCFSLYYIINFRRFYKVPDADEWWYICTISELSDFPVDEDKSEEGREFINQIYQDRLKEERDRERQYYREQEYERWQEDNCAFNTDNMEYVPDLRHKHRNMLPAWMRD